MVNFEISAAKETYIKFLLNPAKQARYPKNKLVRETTGGRGRPVRSVFGKQILE